MGSCSGIIKPSRMQADLNSLYNYQSKVNLKIQEEEIELILTKPAHVSSEMLTLDKQCLWITSCVMPGQDPMSAHFKKCLDNCLFFSDSSSILLALFDGHGPEGIKIVNFCSNFTAQYFRDHKSLLVVIVIQESPVEYLRKLIEECDTGLMNSETFIDTSYSGT